MNDSKILRGLIDLETYSASPRRTRECAYTILMYCKVFEVDTEHRQKCAEEKIPPSEDCKSLEDADKQLQRHNELQPHISKIKDLVTDIIKEMDNVDYRRSNDSGHQ